MTLRDLFEFALVGAADLGESKDIAQLHELWWRWRSEENTDVDLIDFKQAYPA